MIKTVSANGYDFEVDFDYQPAERMTRDYPGCSESVEINEVMDSDGDMVKEYAFELLENALLQACLDAVHDDAERISDAQIEAADRLVRERRLSLLQGRISWNAKEQKSITNGTRRTGHS